jgi:mono/diheme cytochrome c family protein
VARFRLVTIVGGLLLVVSQVSAQQYYASATQGAAAAPVTQAPAAGDIARGRYIVESVAMCGECHSSRDGQGTIIPSTRFMGGPIPVMPPWPNTWANRAPRIAGLPGYTDDLAVRLLTKGAISRDGYPLRLPMPRFTMTREDALAVATYLRSQQ